ncbi:MAG: hypothetical protein ACE5H2_10260 [Terriglobia bacterium]
MAKAKEAPNEQRAEWRKTVRTLLDATAPTESGYGAAVVALCRLRSAELSTDDNKRKVNASIHEEFGVLHVNKDVASETFDPFAYARRRELENLISDARRALASGRPLDSVARLTRSQFREAIPRRSDAGKPKTAKLTAEEKAVGLLMGALKNVKIKDGLPYHGAIEQELLWNFIQMCAEIYAQASTAPAEAPEAIAQTG